MHPSNVKVWQPKVLGNAFSSILFSKIFWVSMLPHPLGEEGLKGPQQYTFQKTPATKNLKENPAYMYVYFYM